MSRKGNRGGSLALYFRVYLYNIDRHLTCSAKLLQTLPYECFSTNVSCLDGSTIPMFSSKYINKMPSGNLVGERKNTKILKKKNVKEEE